MWSIHRTAINIHSFDVVAKTLVIQKEKSQLQSELEKANKELAALYGKPVSLVAVNCSSLVLPAFVNTSNFYLLYFSKTKCS